MLMWIWFNHLPAEEELLGEQCPLCTQALFDSIGPVQGTET